jgi:hypothetical protein
VIDLASGVGAVGLRDYARAGDVPAGWWPAGGDPRRTRAWAVANRWPGDGAGFLASGRGDRTFAAVRRVSGHTGWSRMNAVDVCAGRGRDVEQDPAVLAAARTAAERQLNLALAGYATPVWAPGPAGPQEFLADVTALAVDDGASPAVLHVETGSPVLAAVRALGWTTGVTDLYATISDIGTCLSDYLAARRSKQRVNIRRDLRRLADAGGQAHLVRGAEVALFHDEIAALEARSDDRHGVPGDPGRLRAMNERLLAEFGPDMAAGLVRDAAGTIVASCTMLHAGGRVLPRFVGLDDVAARPLAGYFHAGYYLALSFAWQCGAGEILLGPGSPVPKLLRGATLRPVFSAVPPGPLAVLLRGTDRVLRDRAERYGFPIDTDH